jgi:uncharacterized membrane protein
MTSLICGFILFFGLHCMPDIGNSRQKLFDKFGEKAYMALYSLVSLAGLVLFIRGLSAIPAQQLWQPFDGSWQLSLVLMWFSLYCMTSMFLPSSVHRITRHPMLLGVLFWSLAHLVSNGQLKDLVLFGSFLILAAYKIPALNKRKPGDKAGAPGLGKELVAVGITAAVFIAVLYAHTWIAGVPLIS